MRRGVSLLEVLFAILVLTIGCLGALALLPVASSQARKGRINDAIAVLAPQAIHDFDARGGRQVQRWIAWNTTTSDWEQHTPPFGESICIDPRFIAANSTNAATRTAASIFPYVPTTIGTQCRMRRVSLDRMNVSAAGQLVTTGIPLGKLLADAQFIFPDDLTSIRPDDNSLLPEQLYDTLPTDPTIRTTRQSDGMFSWMATLCPKVDRYAVGLNDQYVLSVVMFHQRPSGLDTTSGAERVCDVAFQTTAGFTGGEVLLSNSTGSLDVRAGDWILIMGRASEKLLYTIPATGQQVLSQKVPQFKWYRVSDCEPETTAGERYVTLMGPDWDMDTTDHQAVLMEGVVGVYEKTVRLE